RVTNIAADRMDESASRAAEALRRVDPSLRVILVTRNTTPPARSDLAARGFDDWFPAPLRMDDVQRLCGEDALDAAPTIEIMRNAAPAPVAPKVSAATGVSTPRSPAEHMERDWEEPPQTTLDHAPAMGE